VLLILTYFPKTLTTELEDVRQTLNVETSRRSVQEEALRYLWDEVRQLRKKIEQDNARRSSRAATLIQRHWRGYWTRRLYGVIRDNFRNHCKEIGRWATVIQKVFNDLLSLCWFSSF
jgi:hypothetical protein